MISNETPNQRYENAMLLEDAPGALAALNTKGFMFEALSNEDFVSACSLGNIDLVNRLLEVEVLKATAAANHNRALRGAAENGYLDIVNRLLEIDMVKAAAAADHNRVLRRAARNGHLDVVNSLLLIDSVLNNATALNNDALTTAIHHEHHAVAARLRQIPAVDAHEREHPILPRLRVSHRPRRSDIARLAADGEGAIVTPPVKVMDNFANLQKPYKDQFNKLGRAVILDSLRKHLAAEYLKKPAQYLGKNLPLEYDKSLAEEALSQYYSHPYHTAWRYLFCKPNPWIAPDTEYFYQDPQGGMSAEMSVEALDTIAYLWLAASDTKEKRPEGIQDRLIEMLCDAARGHNFDKDKAKDDGEGDKPSCSLGIEGRVLQFLMLLDPQNQPLTPAILCNKFKAFVIAENQGKKSPFDKINALNLEQLEQLSKAMVKAMVDSDDLSEQEKEILKPIFTIDPSLEKAFFAQCHQEHAECFKEDKPRSFVFDGKNFTNYEKLAQHLFNKVLDVFYNPLKEKVEARIKALKPAPVVPVSAPRPVQNVERDAGAEEDADKVKNLHARRKEEEQLRDRQNVEAARQYDAAARQQIEGGKAEDGNQEVKEKHAQREALQQKLNVITQAIQIWGKKKAALQEEIQNWNNLVKGRDKVLEPVLIEKQGELKAIEAKLQSLRVGQEAYTNQIKKLTPDPLENFRQVCDKLIALDKEINVLKGSIEKLPKGTDKESSTLQLLSVRQAEMSRLSEEYLKQKELIKGGTKPVKTS